MPSLKCYQCGKVKRCQMFLEARQSTGGPVETPVYLCRPCARELGHFKEAKPCLSQ